MALMTQEKFEELISMLLEKAKTNRMRYGYSGGDRFAHCAIVFGPSCEQAVMPLKWQSDQQKDIVMDALSHAAGATNASAVVTINDTRWSDEDRFCKYFNVPSSEEIGFEEFQKRYYEIRMKHGNGDIAALPREIWDEAICVSGKGPKLLAQCRLASYREGPNDSLVWIEDDKTQPADMLLLPDWWETTVQ